jgi:hypothetical protein
VYTIPTGSDKDCYWCKNNRNDKLCLIIIIAAIDLIDRWTSVLSKYFTTAAGSNNNLKEIRSLGKGEDDIQAITVIM